MSTELKRLSRIFTLQANLVDQYRKVYGLPAYPLDIDDREHQATLRGFFSALTEELVELHEAYSKLLKSVTENDREVNRAKLLEEINMESADVLHFFLEILLYIGLDEYHIDEYINSLILQTPLQFEEEQVFLNLENVSKFHLKQENLVMSPRLSYPMPLALHPNLMGRVLNPQTLTTLPVLYWDIVTCLNLAQNTLKNKAWKLSPVETDRDKLNTYVLQAFYIYFATCYYLGATTDSILENYEKKNQINLQRITNKY